MSQGYQIINQLAIHYLTFQVVDWVDIFTRQNYRDIILDSFRYSQKEKGLWLYSYVIMRNAAQSNHIHLIAASKDGELSDLVRDIKKFTASKILNTIKTEPESRREWMLKRFERCDVSLCGTKQSKYDNFATVRRFAFGHMKIMLLRFIAISSSFRNQIGRHSAIFIKIQYVRVS